MFLVWRALFGLGRWRIVRLPAAWALIVARRVSPGLYDRAVGWFDRHLVRSGWPGHPAEWINLHASEFLARVTRFGDALDRPRRPPRSDVTTLRVACVGRLSGLLSFSRELFEACPPDIHLTVFDRAYKDRTAGYLHALARQYTILDESGFSRSVTTRAAATINAADADLVLNVGMDRQAVQVLDRLHAPCVANYCTGSDLMHSSSVDVEMHGQPQADYFARDGRMFSGLTRSNFSAQPVMAITGYYDRRSLNVGERRRSWREREPVIVYHGSLRKIAHAEYVDTILGLLAEDRELTFTIMGKDDGRALAYITGRARQHGVDGRINYDGAFSAMRGSDGEIDDEGWLRLLGWLGRARLAADPWPVGGGSARFEAYVMGVPSAHMGVRFDPQSWGWPQPAACDVPFLAVPAGTATSVGGYRALCRRCLYDEAFANDLQAAQQEVALRSNDAGGWWRQVRECYDFWVAGRARGRA